MKSSGEVCHRALAQTRRGIATRGAAHRLAVAAKFEPVELEPQVRCAPSVHHDATGPSLCHRGSEVADPGCVGQWYPVALSGEAAQMRIIDLSGPIENGMWSYGPPYPDAVIQEIEQPDFIEHETFSWRFELGAQTGTYLETSLHVRRDGPELIEVPVEDLFMRDATVLRVPCGPDQRIEREDLEGCDVEILSGDAVIVATGWEKHWNESDFVSECPWFSYEAMRWILDHEPFMMCGDMPRFDSWDEPQGFWEEFFEQGVLLLAPLINLGQLRADRVKLTALPMKVVETCAAPCRVVATE